MKASRNFKIIAVLLSLFLAWIFLAPFLARGLIVEKPLAKSDVILVLGGSSTFIERTRKAAELYQKGVAPKIFLTDDDERAGWSSEEQRNPKFVELAQKKLIEQGVSPSAIEILEPAVEGTIDEARAFAEKARTENIKSALLVTSAYHTRRARWTFENILSVQNVEIGIQSPPSGIQTPAPSFWWLEAAGWRLVAGEYVKGVYYWANY